MRLIWFSFVALVSGECYWKSKNHYLYYGNKTPYDIVRGDIRNIPPLEGCQPMSIWFMVRHGTRFPDEKDFNSLLEISSMKDQLVQSYAEGNGTMCDEDIEVLKRWTWDQNLRDNISKLTLEGYKELMYFGMRFAERFLNFLGHLDNYVIQATNEQRTAMSGRAFLRGMKRKIDLKLELLLQNDMVIRPYRHCVKRARESLHGRLMLEEIDKYTRTEEFQEMVQRVRARTGLQNLTAERVIDLYNICRYLRSFTADKTDPWCALFRNDDLEVLEYVEDIRFYFVNGYGTAMNKILGAAGLRDLYEKFVAAHNGSHSVHSMTGYFSHGAMLDMMHTALGAFFWPITGLKRDKNRIWRKSFMTPFGGTFIVILQRCDNGAGDKVQFFTNEKEIFPCGDKVCSWEDFTNKLEQFSDNVIDFC